MVISRLEKARDITVKRDRTHIREGGSQNNCGSKKMNFDTKRMLFQKNFV